MAGKAASKGPAGSTSTTTTRASPGNKPGAAAAKGKMAPTVAKAKAKDKGG